jgi:hypothetical protein
MSWPLISEFLPLLKTPKVAFSDEVLRACVIETDARDQPLPRSGNFASVFKAFTENGSGRPIAVRIFSRQVSERRDRYQIVANFLAHSRTDSIVNFSFIERGIRSASDGRFYPIVTMDWVEGESLYDRVARACISHDGFSIRRLAERWLTMDEQHSRANISHGDLQHANVIVTPDDQLKLVDYDCFFVPELRGRANLEVGIPPYQHPDRNDNTILSERLHFFSSQFIYTALRCLAQNPQLWQQHVVSQQYDKLLFRATDLQSPDESPLMNSLLTSGDPIVVGLVNSLLNSYRKPIEETQPLRYVVKEIEAAANPYLVWFGVNATQDSAPNYYELLAIKPTERDSERIREAAELRLNQLVIHATPNNRELSQRMISEINAAQLTLLHPDARRDYNLFLQDRIPVAAIVPPTEHSTLNIVPKPPLGTTPLSLNEINIVQPTRVAPIATSPSSISLTHATPINATHQIAQPASTQIVSCPFCQMPMNVPTAMAARPLRCVSCGQMIEPLNIEPRN